MPAVCACASTVIVTWGIASLEVGGVVCARRGGEGGEGRGGGDGRRGVAAVQLGGFLDFAFLKGLGLCACILAFFDPKIRVDFRVP